ncbi:LysR substrate-binding domain-containing protein [Cytobacillus horneckiae]|uniref:LysR substrate-binding domain-containing protein n=1 Tax=Cytobacillus horneckiae TaxID=549687 RepID=A0A2N0ZDW6_9BACI|nr:hypothetical protein CWS20_17490 [Cytobacillus horneckiae]
MIPKDFHAVNLSPKYSCSWRPIFEEYLYKEGKGDFFKIELPSIEAIKKCILCGLGKCMLPHFTINKEMENGEFSGEKLNKTKSPIAIYIATHKNKWRSINLNTFIDYLNNYQKTNKKYTVPS